MTNLIGNKFPGFPQKLEKSFWQFPSIINGHVHSLSGAEFKVLWYILRHTFGWQKEQDNISIQQICCGIKKKNGEQLDKGTGLSRRWAIKALNTLEKKGFIVIKREKGKVSKISPNIDKDTKYTGVENTPLPVSQNTPVTGVENTPTINNSTINNTIRVIAKNSQSLAKDNFNETKTQKLYKRLTPDKQRPVHRLGYHLEDTLGTKIVNWGKQAKAVSMILKAGYTEPQIIKVIDYMASKDDFFYDKGFDLMTVANNIGRFKAEYERNKKLL